MKIFIVIAIIFLFGCNKKTALSVVTQTNPNYIIIENDTLWLYSMTIYWGGTYRQVGIYQNRLATVSDSSFRHTGSNYEVWQLKNIKPITYKWKTEIK